MKSETITHISDLVQGGGSMGEEVRLPWKPGAGQRHMGGVCLWAARDALGCAYRGSFLRAKVSTHTEVGILVELLETAKDIVVALECPGTLVLGPLLPSNSQTPNFISKAELTELSTILLATSLYLLAASLRVAGEP